MSIAAYRLPHLGNTTCIVVGLGLIGRATASHLSLIGSQIDLGLSPKVNWSDPQSILGAIRLVPNDTAARCELIWCAGQTGFSATDSQLEAEYLIFQEVIEQLTKVHQSLGVSFMSSAGGLYEGSGGAQSETDPITPLRPYAQWKLKQETFLQARIETSRIYRISSVYGVSSRKSRQGIVNALIESTYTNTPALIYAKASTLRDYVSNLDVSKYVVSKLALDTNMVAIIASGRPTSIDMIANLVKRVTRRNLKIIYRPSDHNDKDIIFSKRSLPVDFHSRSLEEGILNLSATYRQIKFSGV